MCPMIEGVTHTIWHGLSPFEKLIPVGGIASDVFFGYSIGSQGSPFVMVTTEPKFCNGTESMVFSHFLRIKMTVVVYDR